MLPCVLFAAISAQLCSHLPCLSCFVISSPTPYRVRSLFFSSIACLVRCLLFSCTLDTPLCFPFFCSLAYLQNHLWQLFARHTTMTLIILYLVYTQVSTVVSVFCCLLPAVSCVCLCFRPIYSGVCPPFQVLYTFRRKVLLRLFSVCSAYTYNEAYPPGSHRRGVNTGAFFSSFLFVLDVCAGGRGTLLVSWSEVLKPGASWW